MLKCVGEVVNVCWFVCKCYMYEPFMCCSDIVDRAIRVLRCCDVFTASILAASGLRSFSARAQLASLLYEPAYSFFLGPLCVGCGYWVNTVALNTSTHQPISPAFILQVRFRSVNSLKYFVRLTFCMNRIIQFLD